MTKHQPPKLLPPHFERVNGRDFVILWVMVFIAVSIFVSEWHSRIAITSFIYSIVVSIFHVFAVRPVHPVCLEAFLNGLKVGAHRGLSLDAPENTLGAFKLSKSLGADAVEFDLEFTKDGIPVVLHDDTVDRTTDGKGSISEMTFEEVRKLNAAVYFGDKERFSQELIPTLDETIELLLQLEMKIFIDVKNPHPNVVDTIINLYKKHDTLYLSAAVCSFFPQVVYRVKRADWRIITGHTWRPGYFTHKDYNRHIPYHEGWLQNKALHWLEELYVMCLHRFYWKITGASLFLTDEHCVSAYVTKAHTVTNLKSFNASYISGNTQNCGVTEIWK